MPNIVILGAGIQGLSTAYYLTRKPGHNITLVDPARDACQGASGRPTAFLSGAKITDLNLDRLVKYSLALHTDLAATHDGATRWAHQKVLSYDVSYEDDASCGGEPALSLQPQGLEWLSNRAPWTRATWSASKELTSIDSQALGEFLLEEVKVCGARVLFGTQVTSVKRRADSTVSYLIARTVSGDGPANFEIPCDSILIAAGPWSASVFADLYPTAELKVPIRAHTGSYSLLLALHSDDDRRRWVQWRNKSVVLRRPGQPSVQFMMRTDGLVHAATAPSPPLELGSSADNTNARLDEIEMRQIEKDAQALLSLPSQVRLRRACFNPVTISDLPILSQVPKSLHAVHTADPNVYILGGHGYWGITASLGSGKLMAQLLLGEEVDLDLAAFCIPR